MPATDCTLCFYDALHRPHECTHDPASIDRAYAAQLGHERAALLDAELTPARESEGA